MGRVRTKTIKRGAKVLLEKYYLKLTNDFHTNKKILSEVGQVPTKKLRNKIAGFATHLMKRIQKGPVKGISLKVQEEERERRLDWVPTVSEISIDKVVVDAETLGMLNEKFGEAFVNSIKANLQDKTENQPKKERQNRGPRKDNRNKPPRRERPERKEGDAPRTEGAPAAEGATQAEGESKPRGEKKERAPRAVRPAAKN